MFFMLTAVYSDSWGAWGRHLAEWPCWQSRRRNAPSSDADEEAPPLRGGFEQQPSL